MLAWWTENNRNYTLFIMYKCNIEDGYLSTPFAQTQVATKILFTINLVIFSQLNSVKMYRKIQSTISQSPRCLESIQIACFVRLAVQNYGHKDIEYDILYEKQAAVALCHISASRDRTAAVLISRCHSAPSTGK